MIIFSFKSRLSGLAGLQYYIGFMPTSICVHRHLLPICFNHKGAPPTILFYLSLVRICLVEKLVPPLTVILNYRLPPSLVCFLLSPPCFLHILTPQNHKASILMHLFHSHRLLVDLMWD